MEDTNTDNRGTYLKMLATEERLSLARRTFLTMMVLVPVFRPVPGEKSSAHRRRVELLFCVRWGCAPSTFRHFTARVPEGREGPSRRPSPDKNPGFFKDLRKYGGVRFTAKGAVVKGTLNTGPDYMQFRNQTPPGRDLRRSAY